MLRRRVVQGLALLLLVALAGARCEGTWSGAAAASGTRSGVVRLAQDMKMRGNRTALGLKRQWRWTRRARETFEARPRLTRRGCPSLTLRWRRHQRCWSGKWPPPPASETPGPEHATETQRLAHQTRGPKNKNPPRRRCPEVRLKRQGCLGAGAPASALPPLPPVS